MQLFSEPLLLYGLSKTILKSVDPRSLIARGTSSDVLQRQLLLAICAMQRIRLRGKQGRRQDKPHGNTSSCFNVNIPMRRWVKAVPVKWRRIGSVSNVELNECWGIQKAISWKRWYPQSIWAVIVTGSCRGFECPLVKIRISPHLFFLSAVDSRSLKTHCVALCAWGQSMHLNVLSHATWSNSRNLASGPTRD